MTKAYLYLVKNPLYSNEWYVVFSNTIPDDAENWILKKVFDTETIETHRNGTPKRVSASIKYGHIHKSINCVIRRGTPGIVGKDELIVQI